MQVDVLIHPTISEDVTTSITLTCAGYYNSNKVFDVEVDIQWLVY